MRRDSTTYAGGHQDTNNTESDSARALGLGQAPLIGAAKLLAAMALGALLLALAYQIPVTHTVDIGGYDAAYVQGFYDPERNSPSEILPELIGSDGSARWTRDSSYLLFPQAGLPAQVTLRLRGWRAGGRPPQVVVLLNGARELGRFQAGADWQDYSFAIDGGLLKPNDVVIEIRSETARHSADDPRQVGVLLDRATYRVGPAPIVPYPAQLLYGALAAGMLYVLLRYPTRATGRRGDEATERRGGAVSPARPLARSPTRSFVVRRSSFVVALLVLCSLFFVLYRAQPPYPYPLLRLLPAIDGALAALLALRYGPALARRAPALLDALALGGIGAWTAAALLAAQRHVTLSLPGVEKDFRVFALRSARLAGSYPAGTTNPDLDGVFRADGFYNLGYPLLLWLARPLTSDNPFLAARLIAALSGMLLLLATWWLARQMLGRGPALLALVALALSPLVVEHALYLGTDMPFAAACTLALALILCSTNDQLLMTNENKDQETRRPGDQEHVELAPGVAPSPRRLVTPAGHPSFVALAGLAAGAAFLIRHPGLLLLPLGWLTIWRSQAARRRSQDTFTMRPATWSLRPVIIFTVAFALAVLPQIVVNLRDTGGPLYSQQAKNVWQAVFGGGDWGRWGETANDIGIGQVVAQDPARFLANWWANLRGFLGTGGEDTREFGQAAQLRLLAFPANWLGVVGLLGWLASMFCHHQDTKTPSNEDQTGSKPGSPARPLTRSPAHPFTVSLLLWIALSVASVSVGLALQPRFVLPLAPIYAIAAAWVVARLRPTTEDQRPTMSVRIFQRSNLPTLAGILLLALLWGGFATGAGYVLRSRPGDEAALARAENRPELPGQAADEVGIIQLVQATLRPGERLLVRADPGAPLGKYSAIAHLAVPVPASDAPEALRAAGAQYLVWSATLGPAPVVGPAIGAAGIYTLYRIER